MCKIVAVVSLLLLLGACADQRKPSIPPKTGPITGVEVTAADRKVIEDHIKTRVKNRLKVMLYNTKGAYFSHHDKMLICGRINLMDSGGRGIGRQPFFAFMSRGTYGTKGKLDSMVVAPEGSPMAAQIHKLCGKIGISV